MVLRILSILRGMTVRGPIAARHRPVRDVTDPAVTDPRFDEITGIRHTRLPRPRRDLDERLAAGRDLSNLSHVERFEQYDRILGPAAGASATHIPPATTSLTIIRPHIRRQHQVTSSNYLFDQTFGVRQQARRENFFIKSRAELGTGAVARIGMRRTGVTHLSMRIAAGEDEDLLPDAGDIFDGPPRRGITADSQYYGNRLEEILKEILDVSWSPNREPYPGSSPGEAPARRTGNLRDSIKVTSYQIGEEFEFSVRAADYAGFLEEGTRKMSPRQFMMKGLHQLFIEEGPIEVARYEIKPINRRSIRII